MPTLCALLSSPPPPTPTHLAAQGVPPLLVVAVALRKDGLGPLLAALVVHGLRHVGGLGLFHRPGVLAVPDVDLVVVLVDEAVARVERGGADGHLPHHNVHLALAVQQPRLNLLLLDVVEARVCREMRGWFRLPWTECAGHTEKRVRARRPSETRRTNAALHGDDALEELAEALALLTLDLTACHAKTGGPVV